jgi:DNA-binding transcriptional ArsR family regulator
MIEICLTQADLVQVRFAHSPVRELVASLRLVRDPSRHPMYESWFSDVGGRLRGLKLDLLTAVAALPVPPAFLTPTPTAPWGVLADELEAIGATPPAIVRAQLREGRRGRTMPETLRNVYDDPTGQLRALVDEISRYWQAAFEPLWQRLQALCMADVSYRLEQFAAGGLARVLDGLHTAVSFAPDRILVADPTSGRERLDLDGTGILLVPCAFCWPTLTVSPTAGQLSLIYPPRGLAELWRRPALGQDDPLFALLGRTRAMLLTSLGLPTTTTQLARDLDMSAAAVSQHLKVLKACGLAAAHRRGRTVLYQRTPAATALLATTSAPLPRLSGIEGVP